jgi:hypothetical protein
MINGDRLIIGKYLMQKLFSVPRRFYIRGSILRQIKRNKKKVHALYSIFNQMYRYMINDVQLINGKYLI